MKESTSSLFLIFLFALISCSKDSPRISSTHFSRADQVGSVYTIDREEHNARSVLGGTTRFQYVGSKVVKRIGSIFLEPGVFHPNGIYDTVEYTAPNEITIESKDNSDYFDVYPLPRVITLENGRVARKITYDSREIGFSTRNDTIYYLYSENGYIPGNMHRLIKTVQYIRGGIVTRDYSYDHKGNLQNITTVTNVRYLDYTDTARETFGGYDNKPNPLQGVCLWQDLLDRTLSTNNFTTYTYRSRSGFQSMEWTLTYDSNGNVDYSN